MPSKFGEMISKGLVKDFPRFILNNIHYETIMGSIAYGVNEDTSDFDICGFVIPPKNIIFPHLEGYIPGFGTLPSSFEVYQKHHIFDINAEGGKGREYDFSIYNIVKFFDLCMGCNPNMIDCLYTPRRCILHITRIGERVRENRKLFLSKLAWHKFKGYAYSQMHKMKSQNRSGKRSNSIEKYGYDVKFGYHLLRLMGEIQQILEEEDLDLERNKEQLKSVRRGEWKLEEIEEYFARKEKSLEEAYQKSSLPYKPKEKEIKELLISCLKDTMDGVETAIVLPDETINALREINKISGSVLSKYS